MIVKAAPDPRESYGLTWAACGLCGRQLVRCESRRGWVGLAPCPQHPRTTVEPSYFALPDAQLRELGRAQIGPDLACIGAQR